MAKKTHPHKMVIFLKKNTKKFAFSVRKPIMEDLRFEIKSDLNKDKKWYGWKYVDWDSAYTEFENLIEKIENKNR